MQGAKEVTTHPLRTPEEMLEAAAKACEDWFLDHGGKTHEPLACADAIRALRSRIAPAFSPPEPAQQHAELRQGIEEWLANPATRHLGPIPLLLDCLAALSEPADPRPRAFWSNGNLEMRQSLAAPQPTADDVVRAVREELEETKE